MVKQVHLNKIYVILEKDGIPIAALMDVDEFEDYLEVRAPRYGATLRSAIRSILRGSPDLLRSFSESLKRKRRKVLDVRKHDAWLYCPHHPTL